MCPPRQYCQNEGMELASIRSVRENQFVSRQLEKSTGDSDYYWLGGVRNHLDGRKFHWLGEDNLWLPDNNGRPYQNWHDGQPSQLAGTQDYLCIQKINGEWHDCPRKWTLYSLCKVALV